MSLYVTPLMRRIYELSQRTEGVGRYDIHYSGRCVEYIQSLVDAGYMTMRTVGEGSRKMKRYFSTGKPVPEVSRQRGHEAPKIVKKAHAGATLTFKAALKERRKRFSDDEPAIVTSKTKYTKCPHSPVYSNVQVAPGEKVPPIFRGVPGLDPLTGMPWA